LFHLFVIFRASGTGKMSIYGPTFPDENLTTHKHDKSGMVREEGIWLFWILSFSFVVWRRQPMKHIVFGISQRCVL
jgi:hypothetical protein